MRFALVAMFIAVTPSAVWQRVWKESNSHASAHRGAGAYSSKKFESASRSFAAADRAAPTPKNAFNLGTSQIAAGKMTEGSATLGRAMKDPALRAASFYNRGNSALASKAYEYAVRDYVEALKLRPDDPAAKRNLEIALEQLQAMRKQNQGRQGPQQPSPSQQKNQKAPSGGQQEEEQQQSDAEALLRSVQQQEQEELQRMKRARGDSVRVGW